MPAVTNHPCFEAPADSDIKIWRYMDFTKFISLLETSCLFLSRIDKFEDPFEGSTSFYNKRQQPNHYKRIGIPESQWEKRAQSSTQFNLWTRMWTYVNCWHMNNFESAAMWKLYTQTEEAIAIQSTYSKLHACLNEDCFLGVVKYIDYDKDYIPEDNIFWPYIHKRLSFEHEKELRILMQTLPAKDGYFDYSIQNEFVGQKINIDLNNLIETIYVSPSAPNWFFEVVAGVTNRYAYSFNVSQSNLSRNPIF